MRLAVADALMSKNDLPFLTRVTATFAFAMLHPVNGIAVRCAVDRQKHD